MDDATFDEINAQADAMLAEINAMPGRACTYFRKTVSWDDVQRGTVDGALSAYGPNIKDVRVFASDGAPISMLRPDNWVESLLRVSVDDLAVVVGNHTHDGTLRPTTLGTFLAELGDHAHGCPTTDFTSDDDEEQCTVRLQTIFLPPNTQFAPEAFSYQTFSATDPKNLNVLCTTQGVAVQADGVGPQKLFHHKVDADGQITQHYFLATATDHGVGGAQRESDAEREGAVTRGQAMASVIGLKSMGTRCNVLMTVQVPLVQREPPPAYRGLGGLGKGCKGMAAGVMRGGGAKGCMRPARREGVSRAARISLGDAAGEFDGLALRQGVARDSSQEVTVTIVTFYTVAGGVPTRDDIRRAVDDHDAIARDFGGTRLLSDPLFPKPELTAKNKRIRISHVVGHDVFPEPAAKSPKTSKADDDATTSTVAPAAPPMTECA